MKEIMIIKRLKGSITAYDLIGEAVAVIDLDLIQKERQHVFDQVSALDNQIIKLKAERAKLLIETEMSGSAPEVGRINERLHNLRRCRSVFNGQREHFDFMLHYLRDLTEAAQKENRL